MHAGLSGSRASLLLPAQLGRLEHVEARVRRERERETFPLDQVSSSCFIVITSFFEVYDSVQRITLYILLPSSLRQPPRRFDQLSPPLRDALAAGNDASRSRATNRPVARFPS